MAVAVVVGKVEETAFVVTLHRGEGGQRVEALRVTGIAHGAEGYAVAIAAGEKGIEGHHQLPQAVDVGLRQHEVCGAVVVPHLEGRQAAVGVADRYCGVVLAVVFQYAPPLQALFKVLTVGYISQ